MSKSASTYHQSTDENLMRLLASGDRQAFTELYHRYGGRMHAYFYRMLHQNVGKAEDFVQELFLKLIEKTHTFQLSGCFKTWIYAIANNMVKNEYRRLGRRPDFLALENVSPSTSDTAFIHKLDQAHISSQLAKAIQMLDETHRTCFVLRYQEELSIHEISEIMNCPEGTVKSRIFYATKKLSSLLQTVFANCL